MADDRTERARARDRNLLAPGAPEVEPRLTHADARVDGQVDAGAAL